MLCVFFPERSKKLFLRKLESIEIMRPALKHITTAILITANLVGISALADSAGPSLNNAAGHAPIGVMGDHAHDKGEWMLSYRFMHMDMQGNRTGTGNIDADTIVTDIPNRFFGRPMQPLPCVSSRQK